MKKLFSTIFAVSAILCALVLVGCKKTEAPEATTTAKPAVTTVAPRTTQAPATTQGQQTTQGQPTTQG